MFLQVVKILAFFCIFVRADKTKCKVNIKDDLSHTQPVFLQQVSGRYKLWAPFDHDLEWKKDETTVALCSGVNNNLKLTSTPLTTMTCMGDNNFLLGGQHLAQANGLDCSKRITGNAKNTEIGCKNGGKITYLGFSVSSDNSFIPYIESCHDMTKGSTRYTKHHLPRESSFKAIKSSGDDWKRTGSPSDVNPEIWYATNKQPGRLAEILGSATLANAYFVKDKSYLAKGHLTPDCDAIFKTWKATTYFYMNVVPQWQQVNNGNWKILEQQTRDLALNLQSDLTIYQGTEQILTLPDVNNIQREITLQAGGKIEVPKWMWKIIKSRDSAIAVVTLNNPFVTSISPSELLCTNNICAQTNWHKPEYLRFGSGFTYCCTVSDLMTKAKSVPDEANAPNILNYPRNVVQQNYGNCYETS